MQQRNRWRPPHVARWLGCLALVLFAHVPLASAAASSRSVTVVIRTPSGVPASVQLLGKQTTTVTKPATAKKLTAKVSVTSGRYRVQAPSVVYRGIVYSATRSPRSIRASKRSARVTVTFRRSDTLRLSVSRTDATSMTLTWTAPKRADVRLRRLPGTLAPQRRTSGSRVKITGPGRSTVDAGLQPGATYSYALFVRSGRTWQRSTLTAGVPGGAAGAPTFEMARDAMLVGAGDQDVPTVTAGVVSVRLAPGRPTPPIGAGVVLPISPALPGGFVGTVASIAPDGRTVTLAAGGLADAFAMLDITSPIPADPVVIEPDPTTPPAVRSGPGKARRAAAGESCWGGSLDQQISSLRPILTPHGSFHAEVKKSTFLRIPTAVAFDISAALTAGFAFDLETSVAVSCGAHFKKFVKSWMAGPVPVALVFDPTLEIAASGAVKETGFTSTITGGMWAKGQLGTGAYFSSGPIVDGDVTGPVSVAGKSATLGVTLGGSLTFGPGSGADEIGAVAGVNGWLNPIAAQVSISGASSASQAAPCVGATAKTEGGFGLTAKAWAGSFDWSASWNPEALTFSHPWFEKYFPTGCQNPPATNNGDVKATLTWNSSADLDLHVTDPAGEEIYYGHKSSASGGSLDVDANAACDTVAAHPTENVSWPTSKAPNGSYGVQVVVYDECSDPDLAWHLQVWVKGVLTIDQTGTGTSGLFSTKLQ